MDDLRNRIEDWLETVPSPAAPDLDGAIGRGRRVRRARSLGWGAAVAVAALATGAVLLHPGAPAAVQPAGPAGQVVRYPDGTEVTWPEPADAPWVVSGVPVEVADAPGQFRLREDLLRSVPGSSASGPVEGRYRIGPDGPIGGYSAAATVRDPGRPGTASLFVRMTRGGVATDGYELYDPCGRWPDPLNLATSARVLLEPVDDKQCQVRPDVRVGKIVFADLSEHNSDPEAWSNLRSAFTVRPDGTAVSVWVQGRTEQLDAMRSADSWRALLAHLVATLPYPEDR